MLQKISTFIVNFFFSLFVSLFVLSLSLSSVSLCPSFMSLSCVFLLCLSFSISLFLSFFLSFYFCISLHLGFHNTYIIFQVRRSSDVKVVALAGCVVNRGLRRFRHFNFGTRKGRRCVRGRLHPGNRSQGCWFKGPSPCYWRLVILKMKMEPKWKKTEFY